jgi:hypothetical protein
MKSYHQVTRRQHDVRGLCSGRQDLRQQGIRVQRDRREQLAQLSLAALR